VRDVYVSVEVIESWLANRAVWKPRFGCLRTRGILAHAPAFGTVASVPILFVL
jgi:hypothetical protein